jgi:hypothetical protein
MEIAPDFAFWVRELRARSAVRKTIGAAVVAIDVLFGEWRTQAR